MFGKVVRGITGYIHVKGIPFFLASQHVCIYVGVCMCPAIRGRWMVVPGGRMRGGWGRKRFEEGRVPFLLILYLSCLSTESSAVPRASLKPKYYYLRALLLLPWASSHSTARLWSSLSVSADETPLPILTDSVNDPGAFRTNMILPQNVWVKQLVLLRNIPFVDNLHVLFP